MLPFDSTRGPVFLIRYTEVQALLPPHAERRERYCPWMPKLVTERSNSRLLSLFPSKNPFFLFAPLPALSFSSLPLPLSSFTQVGGESGTSRRRSVVLYTGANYPLLYGRTGEGEKEWGKKGRGGKACGRWSIFKNQFRVLN